MAIYDKNKSRLLRGNNVQFETVMLARPNGVLVQEREYLHVGEYSSKNRLKTSDFQTVFFNTFQYGKESDVWDEAVSGDAAAVHNILTNNVDMRVGSTPGDKIVRQTLHVQRYIPSRASELTFAVRLDTPAVGIRRRFGLFDENNGFYFEDAGVIGLDGLPEYNVVIRSNTSGSAQEVRVPRALWNGDKLDGTGITGVIADPTGQQIVSFEYEWYGAGQIAISFLIDGEQRVIHTFDHSNISPLPWCSTPFLPIRIELECISAGQTGDHYLYQGSNSLISEGTPSKLGIAQNITAPITGTTLTAANTWYPVLSIRLKPTALKGIVLPTFFQVATTDNTSVFYRLVRNAVPGAGANGWVDMPDPNAFTQYQTYTAPAEIVSQGTSLDSGFVISGGGGSGVSLDPHTVYQIGRTALGTVSDTYTLLAASSNSNKHALAAMTWIEQR